MTDSGSASRRRVGGDTDEGDRGSSAILDLVTSVGAVLGVGVLLFAVSGVWPPLVAIESGSMEPNIDTGDLVFVMDEHRFVGDGAIAGTGVVTARQGADTGYTSFSGYGDVIVYRPNGNLDQTPIIHRAMFYVTEGENWYDRVDREYIGGDVGSCAQLEYCPAPHAGFITKGDANGQYDQTQPSLLSEPVKGDWVIATAEYRVPLIGWLRLQAGGGPLPWETTTTAAGLAA
jgi:signal peptidase